MITVAISTLDRSDALSACLEAILAGDVLPAEIVVVDQSAGDKTKRVVESCNAAPVSMIYIHHEGRGLGAAQNIAFRQAQQPVVAVTDDDCKPAANWIAKIEQCFSSQPSIDALTGRVLPADPKGTATYAVASRTSTERIEFHKKSMPWYVGSGNNFAVKQEWLRRIGGNDERLGPGSPGQGGVDMDLFYRLLRAGARIRYEPDLLVHHARTDRKGRIARRVPYGYGMGACCILWLRRKDWYAMRILVSWFFLRIKRLLEGILHKQWLRVYEEWLVMTGTLHGLVYGLRV